MNRRAKDLSIPKKVKEAVARRDSFDGWPCCLRCGTPAPSENPLAFSNAHYIRRSRGGLGIEENILTLCWPCHQKFDSEADMELFEELGEYLKSCYKDWSIEKLTYRKE